MRGKCSWFGGPDDKGVNESETLALYPRRLARSLEPDEFYCAIRMLYNVIPGMTVEEGKQIYRDHLQVKVTNLKNARTVLCKIVDWGPDTRTGRTIDLSPGAMKALGVRTDDEVEIELVARPWVKIHTRQDGQTIEILGEK